MQPRPDELRKEQCSPQRIRSYSLPMLGALLLVAMQVGCTHRYGSETLHDIGRYLALQPGVSTKGEVRQRFGQPADVLPAGEGSQWRYIQTNASPHWATFIPYAGLVAGGNTLEVTQAIFLFDTAERYRTVETHTDRRYQNMWASLGATMTQSVDEAEGHVRAEMARIEVPFDERAWKDVKDLLTDLPPTIFGDALKKQEVIAIFHIKCRHVSRQISFESQ